MLSKTVIFILLIILVILYLSQINKHHLFKIKLTPESFSNKNTYHMSNKLSIKLQILANWVILHNNKVIANGNNTTNSTVDLSLKNIKLYDKIKIRISPENNKGAFIGQFTLDNTTYLTNDKNFKIVGQYVGNDHHGLGSFSGGKYLGCYNDISSKSSKSSKALATYKSDIKTISDCHQGAVVNKQIYYAMQNGNECWIGGNYNKYGSKPALSCGMSCQQKGATNSYCGGPNANQVFSTIEAAEIKTLTDKEVGIARNKNISTNAQWLIPKQSELVDCWPDGIWEYVWINNPPDKIPVCNYIKYVEYQPSGCHDPTNALTCLKSVKDNYQIDTTKCQHIYKPSSNYDSNSFFKIINRAHRKAQAVKNNQEVSQYLSLMKDTYKAACQLLNEDINPSNYKALCLNDKNRFKQHCKSISYHNRRVPSNINSSSQNCKKGSLKCKILKEKCQLRNHCFDENSRRGPKCYLANLSEIDQLELNLPGFYTAISKAAQLSKLPSYSRRATALNFQNKITNLIDLARTIEFTSDDKPD